MFSFHDLTKTVIDFIKKPNLSKTNQKKTSHENIHNDIYVTVLIAKSKSNALNLHRLQLKNLRNNNTSSISLPINHSLVNVINCYSDKTVFNTISDSLRTNSRFNMEASLSTDLDDMSDENKNEQEEHVANNLKNSVHTESVMIINSVANRSSSSTKITLKTLNDKLEVSSSSGWVNVCRICHGSESTEDLIAPCRCKGSVALTHLSCLQRWLKESSNSNCELCNHHFTIIRKPKYSFLRSIIVWLTHPEIHGPELIDDAISFSLYTPSAIFATYILMLLCDHAVKLQNELKSNTAHMIAFFSIAGMAAIDFTYSSWIMMALQKHITAWQAWNKSNSHLTVLLPPPTRRISTPAGCSASQQQNNESDAEQQETELLQNIDTNTIHTEVELQSLT